jgi:hypothetical protein
VTAGVEWLTVGGAVEPWERLGLVVHEGLIPLFGTGIRIVADTPPGIVGWALSGAIEPSTDVDGLATELVEPMSPILVKHPLGAFELDHVVVTTDSLERTCREVERATGAPLRRVREVGPMRQGFHRLGGLIVEVVERAGLPEGETAFWGLVLNVEDLDAVVAQLGPDVISASRPAVQPGRSIATIQESAGLGMPVALMSSPTTEL